MLKSDNHTGDNSFVSASGSQIPPPSDLPSPIPAVEREKVQEPEDAGKIAEAIKEQGNTVFKAAKYTEAIELYSKAIGS